MKYMGSKRSMLGNGLGHVLESAVNARQRFVDMFCGSGAVAAHVAARHHIPVWATDLQAFAVALTSAQISKTKPRESKVDFDRWNARSIAWLSSDSESRDILNWWNGIEKMRRISASEILVARNLCARLSHKYPLTRAYGGHYFSPLQALELDSLRALAAEGPHAHEYVAALVDAASDCAASPGHTAQPFSPHGKALPHLLSAWRKDIRTTTETSFERFSNCVARVAGRATQSDAMEATCKLRGGDLAFVDPPYSEVQYSRFYHVLEAVAVGHVADVSGVGRYPPLAQRPQSRFSRRTESASAFNDLMISIAVSGAQAIVTFPATEASNGLTGEIVEGLSSQYFHVRKRHVTSRFSTLGGNNSNRRARQTTAELILHLSPR